MNMLRHGQFNVRLAAHRAATLTDSRNTPYLQDIQERRPGKQETTECYNSDAQH